MTSKHLQISLLKEESSFLKLQYTVATARYTVVYQANQASRLYAKMYVIRKFIGSTLSHASLTRIIYVEECTVSDLMKK
jgi:hypothetical protein